MAELPVGSYTGGIPGFAATKPARGQKLNPNNNNVISYAGHLDNRHAQALNQIGGGRKLYDYRFSFNGFAAELTEGQADALRGVTGVLSVTTDELVTSVTASTPRFLGLDQPGGRGNKQAVSGTPARTSSSASSTPASGRRARASPIAPAPTAMARRAAN